MDKKLKSENMQKSSFLCLCYILKAIRPGRCRERRYADHIFIQIYFRMHHFVVRFSKFTSPQAIDPPNQNPADVPVRAPLQLRKSRIAMGGIYAMHAMRPETYLAATGFLITARSKLQ